MRKPPFFCLIYNFVDQYYRIKKRSATLIRIYMNTTLCSRQIIDTYPCNHQQDKGYRQHPKHKSLMILLQSHMDEYQVSSTGDKCPGFFRIPRPVMPPSILRPNSTHQHSKYQKSESNIHNIVNKLIERLIFLPFTQLL